MVVASFPTGIIRIFKRLNNTDLCPIIQLFFFFFFTPQLPCHSSAYKPNHQSSSPFSASTRPLFCPDILFHFFSHFSPFLVPASICRRMRREEKTARTLSSLELACLCCSFLTSYQPVFPVRVVVERRCAECLLMYMHNDDHISY